MIRVKMAIPIRKTVLSFHDRSTNNANTKLYTYRHPLSEIQLDLNYQFRRTNQLAFSKRKKPQYLDS